MVELDHLSYSSISTYMLCPRAWRYHYVDKVETPTAAALVMGSAFHSAVEGYIAAKANGENPAALVTFWPGAWAKQLEAPCNADIDYGDETPESLDATGKRMLKNKDVVAVIDSITPMTGRPFMAWKGESTGPMIERKVTLSVPGVPVPVIGYIDIVADDGVPIDLKTAGRMWPKEKEHGELQVDFYLAALNQMGWALNPQRKFRYVIVTKGKQPRVAVRETTRTMGELLWLFTLIKDTWEAIEAGAFPPRTDGWKCDPRYCGFWPVCRGAF